MRGKIIGLLESRKFPYVLIFITVLLFSPALFIGWQMDDHFHRLHFAEGELMPDVEHNRWDMFTFMKGEPGHNFAMKDFGTLPWWSTDGIRARFWRPLAVLTHGIDYAFWPQSAWLMHLQSMVWYILIVIGVVFLYRRFMGIGWSAGLAAFFFALDQAHGWPVAWIANRNALLALFFGILTILAHDYWRRSHWKLGVIVAPTLLALSLFSAEAGLATTAYLFAYVIFWERKGLKIGVFSLMPYFLVSIIWLLLYKSQGYGTWGLELYIDPGSEPMKYAVAILKRAPFLFGAQFGFPPAFIYIFLNEKTFLPAWLLAISATVLYFTALFPLIVKDNRARFWFTGMVLSVFPICATFPHERLLLFVGIGAFGLISQFIRLYFENREFFPQGKLWNRFAWLMMIFWIFSKAIASPFFVPISAWIPTTMGLATERINQTMPHDEKLRNQELIMVNAPMTFYMIYFPVLRALNGEPFPKRMRILASDISPMTIERTDEYTLIITPESGFMTAPMDDLFRGKSHHMNIGDVISLTNLTITIEKVRLNGRPAVVSFRFSKPLEDESFCWYGYRDGDYRPFTLPKIHEKITIPRQVFNPLETNF